MKNQNDEVNVPANICSECNNISIEVDVLLGIIKDNCKQNNIKDISFLQLCSIVVPTIGTIYQGFYEQQQQGHSPN